MALLSCAPAVARVLGLEKENPPRCRGGFAISAQTGRSLLMLDNGGCSWLDLHAKLARSIVGNFPHSRAGREKLGGQCELAASAFSRLALCGSAFLETYAQ